MLTTVHRAPRGFGRHLWTWVQAIALVYVIWLAMLLLGSAIVLAIRWVMRALAWAAGVVG